jgi:sporulation protein YlmC with PRC-barrel domain
MKKYRVLSTLVSAGSLLFALTVGAQSSELEDSASGQSTPPSTLPAPVEPVENDASSSVPAEDTLPPSEPPAVTREAPVVTNPAAKQQTLVSSTTVVGITVKNMQGETFGEIREIMIDPETGRVNYVVVTSNGPWGFGKQKSFAVPWEALKITFDQTDVIVELESDKLSLPPHIESSQR